jgi:predicted TIM-barrel fold metal-dependent hydrolase
MEIPRLISVDDHVIEPAHVWAEHLPPSYRKSGPVLVRRRGDAVFRERTWVLEEDEAGPATDCWSYDGKLFPIRRSFAAVSFDFADRQMGQVNFDQMRPGCYRQKDRLADLDANHTEASLSFPTFPRFCGQTFLEASDRKLAAACVRAYNDWMIDDWSAGEGWGRLIPLTLIPLWDAEQAAAEVRRCADKGSHAICFTESPTAIGLPSVFSDFWEPLWQACEETSTVVNMHVGSSSTFPTTSRDAPHLVALGLVHETAERALTDWLCSGILERFPTIKIALSEGQAGWMPYLLSRLDQSQRTWGPLSGAPISRPPSTYIPGRVYACIFDDATALTLRDKIGMGQLMFETDYPHTDSTWPDSKAVAERVIAEGGLDEQEVRALLRGNAIECYGLGRYGLVA